MKTRKHRLFVLVLCCFMISTICMGVASATNGDFSTRRFENPQFNFDLPAYGNTVVGTSQKKDQSGDAYFQVIVLENSSGMPCYLNVLTSNGKTLAGYAATIAGTGTHYVGYGSGYGNVGTYYCPSGQTDNDSSKSASIGCAWHP